MSKQNQEIFSQIWEEVWNKGNIGAADKLIASNYSHHDPAQKFEPGLAGFKKRVSEVRAAFPDIHFTVDEMISEDDKVVSRWTAHATHKADFLGVPATGKRIVTTGIAISRYADGKTVETWSNWDALGLLQQLGAIPQSS